MTNFNLQMQKNIAMFGRAVITVPYDGGGMFAYTIGNHEVGMPELVIVKFGNPQLQCMILNAVSEKMVLAGPRDIEDELILDIDFTMPVKLVRATDNAKSTLTIQAGQYLKTEKYTLLQVILPDTAGKFPGDEGFEEKFMVDMV